MNKMKRILVSVLQKIKKIKIYRVPVLKKKYNKIGGLSLHVKYTPTYPEELPEYEIETIEGQIPQKYYTKILESVKEAVSVYKN